MNVREAYSVLKGPLVFGDENQIRAVRWVEKYLECRQKIAECEHDHQSDCPQYRAWAECTEDILGCRCVSGFDEEVQKEAVHSFVKECKGQ